MSLTCDPKDPRLGRGTDDKPTEQNKAYLIDCEIKEFVRPVRRTYIHRGIKITGEVKPLSPEKIKEFEGEFVGYVACEMKEDKIKRYLTQKQVDSISKGYMGGCGHATTMAQGIAETYAKNPQFYGSTFCIFCCKHLKVEEFVWEGSDEVVGS